MAPVYHPHQLQRARLLLEVQGDCTLEARGGRRSTANEMGSSGVCVLEDPPKLLHLDHLFMSIRSSGAW